ncbi:hypothetical protein PROFUN_09899 [Planoprotostelium fungivorum]|uniref:Uncharacterized protein n=1 Tax=Planoprotostelium fungivorum TaxID=1890364 RepID=A0A2P6NGF9_9EUKA|nr:hypothetical protein PROFUN_09899 [Planoprotostelium fungivorum]
MDSSGEPHKTSFFEQERLGRSEVNVVDGIRLLVPDAGYNSFHLTRAHHITSPRMDWKAALTNVFHLSAASMAIYSAVLDMLRHRSFETGTLVFVLETVGSATIVENAPILKKWIGRGFMYFFLGLLCMSHYADHKQYLLPLAIGLALLVMGALCLGAHYLNLPISTPFQYHRRTDTAVRLDQTSAQKAKLIRDPFHDESEGETA